MNKKDEVGINRSPANFEEAIARLEEVVSSMEKGKLSLDESLTAYREGITLAQFCNRKLDEAEQAISLVGEAEDGTPTEKPFSPEPHET